FSGRQYFNGGANVVGTLNTQAINATGKIYTSNDIQSRYVYASNANINGTWLTDTINKANSSYSRVGTLEGKVSNLEKSGGNKMGTWVRIGDSNVRNPHYPVSLTESSGGVVTGSCLLGLRATTQYSIKDAGSLVNRYAYYECR
ncbi:hypothetical protein, partial [Vibrio anguillarum]